MTLVGAPLELIAEFEMWPTGIAVSRSGRIFVSFPRADQPVAGPTLAEIRDGRVHPFPDESANEAEGGVSARRFTSVHGLRMGPANRLFAIDTGSTALGGCDPSLTALCVIDLDHDAIVRRYDFPSDVVMPTTYLNDFAVDYARGAAGVAYIIDSGSEAPNAIIVLDLDTGRAIRRLNDHPSVRANASSDMVAGGEPLLLRMADAAPEPVTVGAVGIAISADGETLYWSKPNELYAIPAEILVDPTRSDEEIAAAVQMLPLRDFASDGLDWDREGRIYFTDVSNDGVQCLTTANGRYELLFTDPRLSWPDGVALGPDRTVYVTSSQFHRSAIFSGGVDRRKAPFGPPPMVQLIQQSKMPPGPFELRIDERQREHAHMLMITMNDDEYWLHSFKGKFNAGEAS